MAEIRIEQKRRFPWWLWLALVLLLAALAWWLVAKRSPQPEPQVPAPVATLDGPELAGPAAAPGVPQAIVDLQGYVGQPPTPPDRSHAYTAEALRKLAAAIDAAQPGTGMTVQQTQAIRQYADQLQVDPRSREHARIARTAFLSATGAIEEIQRQGFPMLGDQVQELRSAAEAIDPQTPLLEQSDEAKAFLERSSNLLALLGQTQP